jgi:hypothetical protein
MNNLLRARIWPSFSPSCRLYPPGRSPLRDGVEPEAWRPRVSAPATYRTGTETNPAVPRDELPGGTPILFALAALRSVPQAGSQFRGLATGIHEVSWFTHWFTAIARAAWEPWGD